MKTLKHIIRALLSSTPVIAALSLAPAPASAATVDAVWNSAADIPVAANGYTAAGNTVSLTLNFAPSTGTDLVVVKNTALDFVAGTFGNLAQGQGVALDYAGVTYRFVANYFGGSGNDLVLVWANTRAFGWGPNPDGRVGVSGGGTYWVPVPVTATGTLAGKTLLALSVGAYHSLALCSDGTVAAWGNNSDGQIGDNT